MRRIGILWLLGVLALAGCAGQEGPRAEELLERAAQVRDHLASATFVADLTVRGSGESLGMTVEGGASFRSHHAGDM